MKYLFVYLLSSVKFVMGPLTGRLVGLHWIETIFCTILGMMTTVVLLSFLGKKIKTYFNQKREKYLHLKKEKLSEFGKNTVCGEFLFLLLCFLRLLEAL
ncbi:MAG: hypothetical protein EAZ85_01780 [Bacteroidetes bacterium]|nr:MAG: hypothetical protein EAZ85_01780 [Bacteroidota bacterium]TAG95201.1 MAG: hypothetical protein EAZ20_00405 [Bacteroidota bacterium]